MRVKRKFQYEEYLPEADFDIYAETDDDEEAIDRGIKPNEAAFLKGYRSNL